MGQAIDTLLRRNFCHKNGCGAAWHDEGASPHVKGRRLDQIVDRGNLDRVWQQLYACQVGQRDGLGFVVGIDQDGQELVSGIQVGLDQVG